MPGNYNRFNTVSTGDTITAANYNGEFDAIRTNFTPAGLDDASATLAAMRATFDPGESGSENLPGSLEEEIQALRLLVKEITGKTYWYESPSASLNSVCPVGTVVAFYDFNAAVSFDTNVWAYCNGQTINNAGSTINGLVVPDLSGRYIVGFGTDGSADIGSATWATAAVGAASHQVNIAHTHTFEHTHTIGSHTHTVGSLQFQVGTVTTTTFNGFHSNGASQPILLDAAVGSGSGTVTASVAASGSATLYTASGTGSVASSSGSTGTNSDASTSAGSATQSIQPSSVRMRYLIRYL